MSDASHNTSPLQDLMAQEEVKKPVLSPDSVFKRAAALTSDDLLRRKWSIELPDPLDGPNTWPGFQRQLNFSLKRLAINEEAIGHCPSDVQAEIAYQICRNISSDFSRQLGGNEEPLQILRLLRSMVRGHKSPRIYLEEVVSFSYVPGESLDKLIKRFDVLVDRASLYEVKLDQPMLVARITSIIRTNFPLLSPMLPREDDYAEIRQWVLAEAPLIEAKKPAQSAARKAHSASSSSSTSSASSGASCGRCLRVSPNHLVENCFAKKDKRGRDITHIPNGMSQKAYAESKSAKAVVRAVDAVDIDAEG